MLAIKGRIITCLDDNIIEKGLIVVKGEKIEYVGEEKDYSLLNNSKVISYDEDVTIMPGFIDCHTHLTGTESSKFGYGNADNFDKIINATHHLSLLLDAGFTTIRDMSLFGPALKRGVERGYIRGPRIFPGGRILGITSGHSDENIFLPLAFVQEESPISYLVDGVDECLKGTRLQFRLGAEFIKVSATGGVSSMADGLDDVQFSTDELKAITEEARRHGTYVAAHCSGTAGTYQSLMSGVTSIEHGIKLDDKCIELMVKNDATLVPTLSISLGIASYEGLPSYMIDKGKKCAEDHLKSIDMARKANIRIAYGTDYSNSENTPYTKNGEEFKSLVYAGLTPLEAIKTATINAAPLVRMEQEIGVLEQGKKADIVVSKGNPLKDISLLGDSKNILTIIKNGIIEKHNQN